MGTTLHLLSTAALFSACYRRRPPPSCNSICDRLRPAYFIAGVTGAAGKIGIKLTSATLTLGGATLSN